MESANTASWRRDAKHGQQQGSEQQEAQQAAKELTGMWNDCSLTRVAKLERSKPAPASSSMMRGTRAMPSSRWNSGSCQSHPVIQHNDDAGFHAQGHTCCLLHALSGLCTAEFRAAGVPLLGLKFDGCTTSAAHGE